MKRGFTLFEVLVALGLSVALMSMIGFALQFYAQQLNVRDSEARRTQLARAILQTISQDLQACVYPEEFDPDQLAALLAANSVGDSGGGGGASSSSSSSDGDLEVTDATDEELEESTDLVDTLVFTERPGLVGNQYQLQFDVSRLPRLEEYVPMLLDTTQQQGLQDMPSDIKTVSYYVQQVGQGSVVDSISKLNDANAAAAGGLVRRQLDREITAFAWENGDTLRLEQSGDLLAPEVVQIEFAYFDGTQWLFEWNSDTYGALPMAINIRLTLGSATPAPNASGGFDENAGLAGSGQLGVPDGADIYDLMVRLPMAVPIPPEEETDEDLEAAGI